MKKIQRVELNKFYFIAIHCPFCGAKVVASGADTAENSGDGGSPFTPCLHTIFIAHDEGFEYKSEHFNENVSVSLDEDSDDAIESPDFLTDTVTIDDAVKFACYVGMPSGFGSYVGFAPLPED